MAIFLFPLISADDYDAFRRLLHRDIPDTYDEWLYLQTKENADNLLLGHTTRFIEVHPDEFVRYCNALRATYNLQNLRNFAGQKSSGKSY